MNYIPKKLKSKKGETLVEILVAILIIALSAALFAAMYSASMNINLSARKQDEALYDAVTELENKLGDSEKGEIDIYEYEDGAAGGLIGSVEVDVYEKDGLIAYSGDTP